MERHSLRSCAISTRSTNLIFPWISSIKLTEYLICDLPLALIPSILPNSAPFSKPFLLSKCPRNRNYRVLTPLNNSLLTPASSNTISFVILAVQGTRSILLRNHISTASNRFFSFLSSVQASLPYNKTDQTKHSAVSILTLIEIHKQLVWILRQKPRSMFMYFFWQR